MYSRLLLFLSLVFIGCSSETKKLANNKFSDPQLVKIYTLIDQRNSKEVANFFTDANGLYRSEAALGFASIRDTAFVPQLTKLLKDKESSVQASAAYALGQIGIGSPLGDLLVCHFNSSDTLVRGNCILAMAKCIKQKQDTFEDEEQLSLGELKSELRVGALKDMLRKPYFYLAYLDFYSNYERVCWANAFRDMEQRGFHSDMMAHRVKYALHDADKDAKFAMAMAMTRLPENWFLTNDQYVLDWVKMERDSDVRACLMTMLGKIKTTAGNDLLYGYATGQSQSRAVRLNALRAIGKLNSIDADKLTANFTDADQGIQMETLQALGSKIKKDFYMEHQDDFSGAPAAANAKWMNIGCQLQIEGIETALWTAYEAASDRYDKMAYLSAMANASSLTSSLLEKVVLNKSIEAPLKYAAMEALVAQYSTYKGDYEKDIVMPALGANDIGVTALAGDLISSEEYKIVDSNTLSATLLTIEKKLVLPKEVETQIALSKALKKMGSSAKRDNEKTQLSGINWSKVAQIDAQQQAIIKTNKGDIVVQLDVNNAPGTVSYIVELIESGFYNEKYFHRVVPNFVIQAGCPRGDGMGSTDKTIRSEFNLHRYAAGTLGMASAGPDTESCQWFITQWDTPHLEGRYTIFGNVVSGIEIVDLIQQGVQIISMSLK